MTKRVLPSTQPARLYCQTLFICDGKCLHKSFLFVMSSFMTVCMGSYGLIILLWTCWDNWDRLIPHLPSFHAVKDIMSDVDVRRCRKPLLWHGGRQFVGEGSPHDIYCIHPLPYIMPSHASTDIWFLGHQIPGITTLHLQSALSISTSPRVTSNQHTCIHSLEICMWLQRLKSWCFIQLKSTFPSPERLMNSDSHIMIYTMVPIPKKSDIMQY